MDIFVLILIKLSFSWWRFNFFFRKMKVIKFLLCCLLMAEGCMSAKILGILPTPSISHQLPFRLIMRALHARGHEITIITTDPIKVPSYLSLRYQFEIFQFYIKIAWFVVEKSHKLQRNRRVTHVRILEKYFRFHINVQTNSFGFTGRDDPYGGSSRRNTAQVTAGARINKVSNNVHTTNELMMVNYYNENYTCLI